MATIRRLRKRCAESGDADAIDQPRPRLDDDASLDPLAPNPEVANQLAEGTKEEQQTEANLKKGKCQNDK
jgi:hypothetical protein